MQPFIELILEYHYQYGLALPAQLMIHLLCTSTRHLDMTIFIAITSIIGLI